MASIYKGLYGIFYKRSMDASCSLNLACAKTAPSVLILKLLKKLFRIVLTTTTIIIIIIITTIIIIIIIITIVKNVLYSTPIIKLKTNSTNV